MSGSSWAPAGTRSPALIGPGPQVVGVVAGGGRVNVPT
jgi:hypothetical protein